MKKDFRRWCRELRKCAPISIPVRVRRVRRKEGGGIFIHMHANGKPKCILIYISDSLDHDATADALEHEWAHARAYDKFRHDPDKHDAIFGIARAEVYEAWLAHETTK